MSTGVEIRPSPRGSRLHAGWIVAGLAAAALLGVGIGVAVHLARGSSTSAPAASIPLRNGLHGEATWAAGALAAPLITTLDDQTGRRFSLASLRGRTVAIALFDSFCTQACPLEGRALAAAERSLPAAERPALEALYLIDRQGDERSAYLYPFAPRFVTGDLATLSRSGRS